MSAFIFKSQIEQQLISRLCGGDRTRWNIEYRTKFEMFFSSPTGQKLAMDFSDFTQRSSVLSQFESNVR